MKKTCIVLHLLLFSILGMAQTPINTIAGIVIDNQTGLGVGGLIIRLEHGSWLETITTDDGKFHFKGNFKIGNSYSFDVVDPKDRYSPQKATDLRTLEGGTLEAIKLIKPEEEIYFIIHHWENKGKMIDDVNIASNVKGYKNLIVDGVLSISPSKIKAGTTYFSFQKDGYEPFHFDQLIGQEKIIYIPMKPIIPKEKNIPKSKRADFEIEQKKPRVFQKTTFNAIPQNGEKYVWNFGEGEKELVEFRPYLNRKFKKKGVHQVNLTVFKEGQELSHSEEIIIKKSNLPLFISGGLLINSYSFHMAADSKYRDYEENPQNERLYNKSNNLHHIAVISLYSGLGISIIYELIHLIKKDKSSDKIKIAPIPVKDNNLPTSQKFGLIINF